MPKDFSPDRSVAVISTVLFGIISVWVVKKVRNDRIRKAMSGQAFHPDYGDLLDEYDDINNRDIVSIRCRNALAPATPYLLSFLRGLGYLCTPERLDGFVPLCMAENKLVIDLLSERLQNPSTTVSAFSDPIVYCYNSFLGLPVARQAVSYFLAKRFLHTPSPDTDSSELQLNYTAGFNSSRSITGSVGVSLEKALQSINPAHIGIGSGAVGVLNGKKWLFKIGVFFFSARTLILSPFINQILF